MGMNCFTSSQHVKYKYCNLTLPTTNNLFLSEVLEQGCATYLTNLWFYHILTITWKAKHFALLLTEHFVAQECLINNQIIYVTF